MRAATASVLSAARVPVLVCAVLCATAIACAAIGAVGVGAPEARGVHPDCRLRDPALLRSQRRDIRPSDCIQEEPTDAPRPWIWFTAAAVAGGAGVALLPTIRRRARGGAGRTPGS